MSVLVSLIPPIGHSNNISIFVMVNSIKIMLNQAIVKDPGATLHK